MAKDLIIGGASNYTWDDLKYWVNSIKRSGFQGDTVLVATNISKETIEKLTSEGVILELYGQLQEDGSIKAHHNGAPHVERFFYIWNFMNKHSKNYDFVIATDTRDVIFQSNPTVWLDEMIFVGLHSIVTAAEGMKYQDEPWNNQNLMQAFGPFFHQEYKDMTIHNVGVLAGEIEYVRDLFLMIFQLSVNRPIPIVDQVVFNVLMQQKPYKDIVKSTSHKDAWSAQLSITIDAVLEGAGDLGATIKADPSKLDLYKEKFFDEHPTMREDGVFVNDAGTPFVIVHQYDRTKKWKDKIVELYA